MCWLSFFQDTAGEGTRIQRQHGAVEESKHHPEQQIDIDRCPERLRGHPRLLDQQLPGEQVDQVQEEQGGDHEGNEMEVRDLSKRRYVAQADHGNGKQHGYRTPAPLSADRHGAGDDQHGQDRVGQQPIFGYKGVGDQVADQGNGQISLLADPAEHFIYGRHGYLFNRSDRGLRRRGADYSLIRAALSSPQPFG